MDKINFYKAGFQFAAGWMTAQILVGAVVLGFVALASM